MTDEKQPCVVCQTPVDTTDLDDDFFGSEGCELVNGQWVCSFECCEKAEKMFDNLT